MANAADRMNPAVIDTNPTPPRPVIVSLEKTLSDPAPAILDIVSESNDSAQGDRGVKRPVPYMTPTVNGPTYVSFFVDSVG